MTKLSKREMVLAFSTLVIVVGTITYLVGQPKFVEWKEMSTNWDSFQHRIRLAEQKISQKDKWFGRLEEIQKDLPSYEVGKDITAELMRTLEQTASTHGLTLLKRDPGEERSVGQIHEISINCTWEGNLKSLVHFLYAIQTKGAILDIRQLTVTPVGGSPDRLKGGFTVDSAFSRHIPAGDAGA